MYIEIADLHELKPLQNNIPWYENFMLRFDAYEFVVCRLYCVRKIFNLKTFLKPYKNLMTNYEFA